MLKHPTLEKLQTLRLDGMVKAFVEQEQQPDIESLSFEERLGLLADREMTVRADRRLQTRLRKARLKQNACLEDMDYRAPRGLDKALMRQLGTCQWIHDGLNLILLGPTGVGKTWIACALAHKACRIHRLIRAPAPPLGGPVPGPCRWPFPQAHERLCQNPFAGPRRLGTGQAHRRTATGLAGIAR